MKKILATVAAVLVMSATVSMATPTTPKFNDPVKLGEGYIGAELHKRMAFDGATAYASFITTNNSVSVVKSTNGGKTWETPQVLQTSDVLNNIDATSVRLAVSDDPLYAGKKIVHIIWHTLITAAGQPNEHVIYYSYLSNKPKQNGWSTPIKITIGNSNEITGGGTSLAVTNNGAIHILYNSRYVTAASPDSPFSTPTSLPESSGGKTFMTMDPKANLYAAYVNDNEKLRFTKKAASSPTWSEPVTIYTTAPGSLSSNIEMIALNSATYYIALWNSLANSPGKGEAGLLVTMNGGNSWTNETVFTNTPDGDNMVNIAVSAAEISYASEVYDTKGKPTIKVWRSSDNGATWSAPATVKGQKLPIIILDSLGKLNIMVMDEASNLTKSKMLWIKEK